MVVSIEGMGCCLVCFSSRGITRDGNDEEKGGASYGSLNGGSISGGEGGKFEEVWAAVRQKTGIILPPGFQFDPTDEELVGYFLYGKVMDNPCNPSIIPELDLCSTDPWELNEKALMSQNQWYFFSQVTERRATEQGHWEELHLDEDIITSSGKTIGIKKFWVFYIDQVSKKIQTNWVMEEYHLDKGGLLRRHSKNGPNEQEYLNDWVLCRVHASNTDSQGIDCIRDNDDEVELSLLDEVFLSMEDNDDAISFPN
ncbi:hypothetical protein ACH5RR_022943 [Cinchona calisaya]|uniref:NAC domain-containing protein n=1 Tax=Cinchona calisaya TaxID=153742 RepID=A0ABD2ZB37_9GENT